MLVSRKERPTGGGEILCFIYVFVIIHSCMLQKMYNSAPWGHTFRWVAEFGVTPKTETPKEIIMPIISTYHCIYGYDCVLT